MKKMYRICIILGCLSCGMSATADEVKRVVTPLSLGLTYSMQIPSSSGIFRQTDVTVYGLRAGVWMIGEESFFAKSVYGMSLGLLALWDHKVAGLQFSGLGQAADELCGIQVAGLVNLGKARGLQCAGLFNSGQDTRGLQCAGLLNLGADAGGLQCAGLLNWNSGDMTGIQIASGFNINTGKMSMGGRSRYAPMTGIQVAGLINGTEQIDGMQMAVYNFTETEMSGIQVGLVNFAKEACGVQIGLLNWADESLKGLQVGLLNHKPGFYFPGLLVGW